MLDNDGIIVGARVEVKWFDDSIINGIIKYIGPLITMGGEWIGVQLDEPVGRHNGLFKGHQYFTCPHGYGVFTREENIRLSKTLKRRSVPRTKTKQKANQSYTEESLFTTYKDDRPDYLRYQVAKPTGFVGSTYVSESLFKDAYDEDLFAPSRRYQRNHIISKTWKKPEVEKRSFERNLIDFSKPTTSIRRVYSPIPKLNTTW